MFTCSAPSTTWSENNSRNRSRSSWTLRLDVSTMRSTSPFNGSRRARSRAMPSLTRSVSHTACRQPGKCEQLLLVELPQLLHGAELLQEPLLAGRAETGNVVEHRHRHLLVAQLPVVGDGESVRLVAHLLQEVERLGVAGDADRIRLARQVDLFEALREACDADVLESELLEHPDCDSELTLPAVDQQQVRWVRETLAGVRALVAFAEVIAEPAGQHLLHGSAVPPSLHPPPFQPPALPP